MIRKIQLFYVASLLPVFVYLIWGLFTAGGTFFFGITVLAAYLWIIGVIIFFKMIEKRKMRQLDDLLHGCHLHKYVTICEKLLAECGKKAKPHLLLRLSYAHLILGHDEEAFRLISMIKVEKFPKNRIGIIGKINYYDRWRFYHLRKGDISAAEQSLLEIESLSKNRKLRQKDQEHMQNLCLATRFLINMESGNYDGSEQFFTLEYEKAQHPLSRVIVKYALAKIYLHQGRGADAKKAFEDVLNHEGISRYKKEAANYLQAMGTSVSLPPESEKSENIKMLSRKEIMVMALPVLLLILISFALWRASRPNFYPTIEAAFTSCLGEVGHFGRTFFIDEHEHNLTINHITTDRYGEGSWTISHYLKNVRGEERWYACVAVSTSTAVFLPDEDDGFWQEQVYIVNRRSNQELYRTLGRRPLYGFAYKESIHYLSINGYPVDHIILIRESEFGERPLYFWYFADFPLITGPAKDILISFE